MLSNEEKKALKELTEIKELVEEDLKYEDYNVTATLDQIDLESLVIILNLIEKQSREIQCDNLIIERAIKIKNKQSKEIEELKREKETNQQMIQLAETQILGYGQGYKDGLNKETTAAAIVARERENQIIYEGIKHKINMEWVFKIKAKIEEITEEKEHYLEINDEYNAQICDCIIEEYKSLLEKEE